MSTETKDWNLPTIDDDRVVQGEVPKVRGWTLERRRDCHPAGDAAARDRDRRSSPMLARPDGD